jgi:hypothetical protein
MTSRSQAAEWRAKYLAHCQRSQTLRALAETASDSERRVTLEQRSRDERRKADAVLEHLSGQARDTRE